MVRHLIAHFFSGGFQVFGAGGFFCWFFLSLKVEVTHQEFVKLSRSHCKFQFIRQHFRPFVQYLCVREKKSKNPPHTRTEPKCKGKLVPPFALIICDQSSPSTASTIKCIGRCTETYEVLRSPHLLKDSPTQFSQSRRLLQSFCVLLKQLLQHKGFCSPADTQVLNRITYFCQANPSSN